MLYRKLVVPLLVFVFLALFGGTAAAQTPQDTITPTLAITASVQAPAEVVFTQPFSFPVVITNTGEVSVEVSGKVYLYYSRIVSLTADVTVTTQITTPNAYDSAATFSLEQPLEPGQSITVTVFCEEDYTGGIWSEVTLTATSPVTNSGMALFLENTWNASEPYDLAIRTKLAPSSIISGDIVSLQVTLVSGRMMTETRAGVFLHGFAVLDWTIEGDDQSIFVSVAEGNPFMFWDPSATPQEVTVVFRLRFTNDEAATIRAYIAGKFFPAGQEWKYDKSTADNEVLLKPGEGFEIVVVRDYLPMILK